MNFTLPRSLMLGLLLVAAAACGGSSDGADAPESAAADAVEGAADDVVEEAGDEDAESEAGSGDAESTDAEIRDAVTDVRESFDNVVEATSDTGVLVAAGLSCPEEGDPFMMIGARGLTGDDQYVADVAPELSFELNAVAQPDGTFAMRSDADATVDLYTITLATIGSGITLELPGCAS